MQRENGETETGDVIWGAQPPRRLPMAPATRRTAGTCRLRLPSGAGLLVPSRRLISLLEAVKGEPPNSNNVTTKQF